MFTPYWNRPREFATCLRPRRQFLRSLLLWVVAVLLSLWICSGPEVANGEGNGNPLHCSCLETPVDRGAWWAAAHRSHRVRHDWSDLACVHALEKEMVTHSSILAWRIPGMEEPGGLPSMGSHRVEHDWSDLAAAAEVAKQGDAASQGCYHCPLPAASASLWGDHIPLHLQLSPTSRSQPSAKFEGKHRMQGLENKPMHRMVPQMVLYNPPSPSSIFRTPP